jgi:intracellular sulfur oxidation DsrE/DsrF family protein
MKLRKILGSAFVSSLAFSAQAADLSAIQKAMTQATACEQMLKDPSAVNISKARTSAAVREVVASGAGLESLAPRERQQAAQLGKLAAACGTAVEAIDLAVKSLADVKLDPKEVPLVNGAHDAAQAIQVRLIKDFF